MNTLEEFQHEVGLRRALPSPAACRALREEANVSRAAVARAVGVTDGAVAHWERGTRRPRGEHLAAYLHVLGVLKGE